MREEENANTEISIPQQGSQLGLIGGEGTGNLSIPMPFTNEIVLLDDIHVAGTMHIEDLHEKIEDLKQGSELTFQRGKDNPYDSMSIQVLFKNQKIGFVPRANNDMIARLLDGGKHLGAKALQIEQLGKWTKIHMEVVLYD